MVMKKKGDANFGVAGRLGGMGGQYGRKATNLSAKELKAAGAAKAASKRTVDISKTKRATSGPMAGKTLGPAGKPLTGTVTMPDGKKAVYKDGKRVVKAAPAKTAPKPTSGGGSTATPAKPTSNSSSTTSSGSKSGNKRTNKLAGARYEAMKGQTRDSSSSTTQKKASGAGTYTKSYERSPGGKQIVQTAAPLIGTVAAQRQREQARMKKSSGPKVGEAKTAVSGPYKGKRVYFDGKTWRPKK